MQNGRSGLKEKFCMHNTEINQMNRNKRTKRGGRSSRLHDSGGFISRLSALCLSIELKYGPFCGQVSLCLRRRVDQVTGKLNPQLLTATYAGGFIAVKPNNSGRNSRPPGTPKEQASAENI